MMCVMMCFYGCEQVKHLLTTFLFWTLCMSLLAYYYSHVIWK